MIRAGTRMSRNWWISMPLWAVPIWWLLNAVVWLAALILVGVFYVLRYIVKLAGRACLLLGWSVKHWYLTYWRGPSTEEIIDRYKRGTNV